MKVYRITSTEYKANTPDIFLFHEGHYYGDMGYPNRDKLPNNIEHWRHAECSDTGRFFKVEELECPNTVILYLTVLMNKVYEYKGWIAKGLVPEEKYCDRIYMLTYAMRELIKRL